METKTNDGGGKRLHEVFSIGYASRDINDFLGILRQNNIELLIDVRNNAYSMRPSYMKERLKEALEKNGIGYMHMPELGIPSELRKKTDKEGSAQLLKRYREELLTEEKISKVADEAGNKRSALMCMEKDHRDCHRGVIADELGRRGFYAVHL